MFSHVFLFSPVFCSLPFSIQPPVFCSAPVIQSTPVFCSAPFSTQPPLSIRPPFSVQPPVSYSTPVFYSRPNRPAYIPVGTSGGWWHTRRGCSKRQTLQAGQATWWPEAWCWNGFQPRPAKEEEKMKIKGSRRRRIKRERGTEEKGSVIIFVLVVIVDLIPLQVTT